MIWIIFIFFILILLIIAIIEFKKNDITPLPYVFLSIIIIGGTISSMFGYHYRNIMYMKEEILITVEEDISLYEDTLIDASEFHTSDIIRYQNLLIERNNLKYEISECKECYTSLTLKGFLDEYVFKNNKEYSKMSTEWSESEDTNNE